jgi:ribonuclease HI
VQVHSLIYAIYTDGSGGFGAYGGRGVCGYAAIVWFADNRSLILGGTEAGSTEQRAELWSLIVSLEYLHQNPSDRSVPIFSDSKYAVDALNGNWIAKWQQNGWLNTKGKPIADRDLWLQIDHFQHRLRTSVTFHHIMAHSDALGRKGRLAQLKNRDRFGVESEQHNRGNQMANHCAGKFRRGELSEAVGGYACHEGDFPD